MDYDCFNMDCLPTFLAGRDLVQTSLYVGSLFSWEKWQVPCHPSSKWHVAQQDYCPDIYPTYANSTTYILSLDMAKRFWR